MKALVLYKAGKFGVENNWPEPGEKEGWARVKVAYAGICGSDLPRFGSTGSYRDNMILGHEFSGFVDRPARNSQIFKGGEKVAVLPIIPCGACEGCRAMLGPFHCVSYQFLGSRNDGGFAEYCLVPETNLFRLPGEMDVKYGAFIEPLAVALHVARRSDFKVGGKALVFGAGAIGILIARWFEILGARQVTITDIDEKKITLARSAGFKEAIVFSDSAFGAGRDYDVVVEAAGARSALISAIEKVKARGAIAVIGRDTGETLIPVKDFEKLMRKEISLKGCWGYNMAGEEDLVYKTLKEGRFPFEQLVSHEVALDDAPETIRMMLGRKMSFNKVLIKI